MTIAETAARMIDARMNLYACERMIRKAVMCEALVRTSGNVTKAAALLGWHRNNMRDAMKSFGIDRKMYRLLPKYSPKVASVQEMRA